MRNYATVPRSDSGGPSIEPSVLRRLRCISPGLKAVWRNYRFDAFNPDVPLHAERGEFAGKPVPWPGGWGRWIMFHQAPGKRAEFLFVVQRKDGRFFPLDGRVCNQLAGDLARQMKPEQIAEYMQQIDEDSRRALKKRLEELQGDTFAANPQKVRQALESVNRKGESDAPSRRGRAAKAIIYPGMDSHASSAERGQIPTTPKEEGWELPDVKEELHG